MINYLAKYIPSLSTKNKKLGDLTKADPFIWEEEHTQILEDLKSSIVSNTLFFNHKSNNVELIVDASSHGLGAHLVSEGKVTAYASRSLSKTEQKYSQLEKELYAIVFGCKHFHHYLYGRHVKVTTDHRPLETVVANPIHKAPPQVQRLMLQLQPYDLSLKFRPGSEIPVADALSRLHLGDADPTLEESLDVYVHQLTKTKQVLQEVAVNNLDMEALSEVRWTSFGKKTIDNGQKIIYIGPEKKQEAGVAMLMF
ncbi:hypothetical protein QYM36_002857 [Artemia franciscana]|uniref:Reverse transcriptase RNase H-like domain-containing protein n=1 Tax=Artemia franciscana TaxID=6661 RepID=A0AA88L8J7_ARTSF|nr:hypothetical protein QYM36_002857 [Artemia franciscana]